MDIKSFNLFKDKCFINGEWIKAISGEEISVNNPATLKEIGTVPKCGKGETRQAIEAANASWPEWRSKSAKERSTIMKKWFDLIMSNKEELAQMMTIEQGKPLNEARGEIVYGASFIEWFAEEAKRIYGDTIPDPLIDRRILVLKQPVGVVASITPWNFPINLTFVSLISAISANNSVIIKPSEITNKTSIIIKKIIGQRSSFMCSKCQN